jgi:hypothetical protein
MLHHVQFVMPTCENIGRSRPAWAKRVDMSYSTPQEWEALAPIRASTGRLLWGLYRMVRPKNRRKDGNTEEPKNQHP